MNPKDFRLGNYIQDAKGVICKITELQNEFEDEKQISAWPINGGGLVHGDFSPIPITEEWLLKFGFENYLTYWHLYHDDICFDISRNFHFQIEEYNYPFKLQYVHQLQNLYFSLTGEELKIKL